MLEQERWAGRQPLREMLFENGWGNPSLLDVDRDRSPASDDASGSPV
jgi:hypothetical protein